MGELHLTYSKHYAQKKSYQQGKGAAVKPTYLPIGTTVMISAHHPSDIRKLYMCEAKIIRHPTYRTGPYKLLVTGVSAMNNAAGADKDQKVAKLLGLKLLRKQESVHPTKDGHWARQNIDNWVRLDEKEVESLVRRAINNIRKEQRKRKAFGTIRGA